MIAWSSMVVGLHIHHLPKRMSGELHISNSSLWLPGTTWAAPLAQPLQDKPSCGACTRSLLLRGDSGTSTWHFTFVLHASTHAGSRWLCLWGTKWEGGSWCLLSFFSTHLTACFCPFVLCGWVVADTSGRCSMTATQLNFTSKLFCW